MVGQSRCSWRMRRITVRSMRHLHHRRSLPSALSILVRWGPRVKSPKRWLMSLNNSVLRGIALNADRLHGFTLVHADVQSPE